MILEREDRSGQVFLEGDGVLEFDWFRGEIPHHDEPFGGLSGLATHRRLTEAAVSAGASMVLGGLGSDEIVDGAPWHLADRLRRGEWLAAWEEAGRWARRWNMGLWTILHDSVLNPSYR